VPEFSASAHTGRVQVVSACGIIRSDNSRGREPGFRGTVGAVFVQRKAKSLNRFWAKCVGKLTSSFLEDEVGFRRRLDANETRVFPDDFQVAHLHFVRSIPDVDDELSKTKYNGEDLQDTAD